MKTFIIADLKLFDESQRKKLNYPNFEIMNKNIIKTWNKAVAEEDKVIIMGDIGSGTFDEMKSVITQLNGDFCYITKEFGDKFSKEEWSQIGIRYIWKVSMFKEFDNGDVITYCINPIRHLSVYEKEYKLIIVDHNNPIDGLIKGKLMTADAAKWYYSPIDSDQLINIYENMKIFEKMENEEHRSDVKEAGEE